MIHLQIPPQTAEKLHAFLSGRRSDKKLKDKKRDTWMMNVSPSGWCRIASMDARQLQQLLEPTIYPHSAEDLRMIETHISWVILAGDFAYKIKKPLRNSFLDYTTLESRQAYCEAELRLNQRFAAELYIDVVAISSDNGKLVIGGHAISSEVIEWAVRMRRFPAEALMSQRLAGGLVSTQDVRTLAATVSTFHQAAARSDPLSPLGSPAEIFKEADDNCRDLVQLNIQSAIGAHACELLTNIQQWTHDNFANHRELFEQRKQQGHVRECHGDLHLGNIVWWADNYVPFDGIEFSEEFRWIDTLSDAAFVAMDLAASGRVDLSRSFLNGYLEKSGDYSAVPVVRWYLVFRAMVRAKVAALRATQVVATSSEYALALEDVRHHLLLAWQFANSRPSQAKLWITHGVSGSGKSTGSEQIVQQQGAFRVRADVERKRIDPTNVDLYSTDMTDKTYMRLAQLAEQLIRSGESVVVDATFLKKSQRTMFRHLAQQLVVPFSILHFEADQATLQKRIDQRSKQGLDASDADVDVLQQQLRNQQPLDEEELTHVEFFCPPIFCQIDRTKN